MFPALLPYMLNLLLFALAVGVVITGLIFRYTTRIQGLAWSFTAFSMPLSCVFTRCGRYHDFYARSSGPCLPPTRLSGCGK
ncbi:MAG: hypothetical protein ACREQ4_06735 [Candidatus Binataceae bacterium]